MPFFPSGTHEDYFKESFQFGYDYDDMLEADLMHDLRAQSVDKGPVASSRLMVLLGCGVSVLTITSIFLIVTYKKRVNRSREEEPLLDEENIDHSDLTRNYN